MTSILSAVSGQFTRALLMGTVLPVLFAEILGVIIDTPYVPSDWALLRPAESLAPTGKVFLGLFITVFLAGLLSGVNIPLIRLYEGYPWRKAWILGEWRTKRYLSEFLHLKAREQGMLTLLRKIENDDSYKGKYGDIHRHWSEIARNVTSQFPSEEHLILPTRLGNIIRSAETYPLSQYDFDGIVIWPRLLAVIDKGYASIIDDAKSSFDFMLNCSFLLTVLALMTFALGLVYPSPNKPIEVRHHIIPLIWLLEWLGLAGGAWIFFRWSLGRAFAWGSTLRSAYDLYRWKLLKQLGHKQEPKTKTAERHLWGDISRQMLYGDAPSGPRPDYDQRTFAIAKPDTVRFRISRGLRPRRKGNTLSVFVWIHNLSRRSAQDTVISDSPPDGYAYVWGSARVQDMQGETPRGRRRRVTVRGTTNVLQFVIGQIPEGRGAVLNYDVMPVPAPAPE